MELILRLLNILLPVLYAILLLLYGLYFFRSDRMAGQHMGKLLRLTVSLHFLYLLSRGLLFGYFPSTTIYELAGLVALAIAAIYLYIEHRLKIQSTGFFILIVAFLLQLFSSALVNFESRFPEVLRSPMFVFHTATVIVGYAALFVSALYGIMYLMLFYDLKSAQFGVVYRKMPSLEELSEMNTRAAILGFLFLTVTIFLGITWRKQTFPGAAHFDPQVIAAYTIWVIYGLVLYGKKIGSWTGKWLAYISIGGFVVIILSLMIIRMAAASFHHFG